MDGSKILSENHWKVGWYKQRITREQLKTLLLEERDSIIRMGRVCKLKKKHLGVGVYEIWFEGADDGKRD